MQACRYLADAYNVPCSSSHEYHMHACMTCGAVPQSIFCCFHLTVYDVGTVTVLNLVKAYLCMTAGKVTKVLTSIQVDCCRGLEHWYGHVQYLLPQWTLSPGSQSTALPLDLAASTTEVIHPPAPPQPYAALNNTANQDVFQCCFTGFLVQGTVSRCCSFAVYRTQRCKRLYPLL